MHETLKIKIKIKIKFHRELIASKICESLY